MRTLVYKRTHVGDPDGNGGFGICDCMKSVRAFQFHNVIGVGGIGDEPRSRGINNKINWIGLGARTNFASPYQHPIITFDHFVLYDQTGRELKDVAPELALRLYSNPAPRYLLDSINEQERKEIKRILRAAKDAPQSKWTPLTQLSLCASKTSIQASRSCRCNPPLGQ